MDKIMNFVKSNWCWILLVLLVCSISLGVFLVATKAWALQCRWVKIGYVWYYICW